MTDPETGPVHGGQEVKPNGGVGHAPGRIERLSTVLKGHAVPVIPPGVELHPRTSIKPEARGKAPGTPATDGLSWMGTPDWQDRARAMTVEQARRYDKANANCGILCGDNGIHGSDIDITNKALVDKVLGIAKQVLGEGILVRRVATDGHHKVLLPFRVVNIVGPVSLANRRTRSCFRTEPRT